MGYISFGGKNMRDRTSPKGRWAGIGCIVLGIIGIVWGACVGYLGLQYIIEGDTWDAWFGFILTFVFMVGLGILSIWMGVGERRQREEQP
jgi:hypothetical protein